MRSLSIACLLAALFVAVAHAFSPNEATLAIGAATKTLTIKCPDSINLGVTNRPAEWISYDRRLNFKRVFIASDNQALQ